MPMLLHDAIITEVVYQAVLLMYGRTLSMLPVMAGYLQSGLRLLIKSFCHVKGLEDVEGLSLIHI